MAQGKYVFLNGEVVAWEDAKVHVFSPVAKYGAGVFEGIRGYWNAEAEEMHLFRLRDHMRRLVYSQTAMRFDTVFDADYLCEKTLDLVRANAFRETIHIRAMAYLDGFGESGATGPTGLAITAVPRPLPKRVTEGTATQVSSWTRIPDVAMPTRIKCNANYANGRFAAIQAAKDGYDSSLLLNMRGKVSEGPGMCFFMIRDGRPVTPSVTSDILESITRTTVIEIFREYFGLETAERDIDRSELYAAEEAFFCGTGWEITPITSIDRAPVGDGKVGPLVRKLQEQYFAIVMGAVPDHAEWRTAVNGRTKSKAAE